MDQRPPLKPAARGAGRFALRTAAVLVLIAVLAWLTVPLWAPRAVALLLPDGWQLSALELRRPGPAGVRVERAAFRFAAAGARWRIDASEIEFRYRGPAIDVTSLNVALDPAIDGKAPSEAGGGWRERLSLPRMPVPERWPSLTVDSLELRLAGPEAAPYRLMDIDLGGDDGAALQATLRPIPLLLIPGRAALRVSDDGMDLRVTTTAGDGEPLLHFRQTIAAPGTPVSADAVLHLDLAQLDLVALRPWFEAAGLGAPLDFGGKFRGRAAWAGTERLSPVRGVLEPETVRARTEKLALKVAAKMAIAVTEDAIEVSGRDLDLTLDAEAHPALQAVARGYLESLGMDGLLLDGPSRITALAPATFEMSADDTGATTLDLGDGWSLDWRQGDAVQVRLAAVTGGGPTALATGASGVTASGKAILEGRHPGPLRLDTGDVSLRLHGIRGELGLDLETALADGPRIRSRIDRLAVGRLQAVLESAEAGYDADLREVALSGTAELTNGDLRFAGPVRTAGVVVVERRAPPGEEVATEVEWLRAEAVDSVLEASWADLPFVTGRIELAGVAAPSFGAAMDLLTIDSLELELPSVDAKLHAVTSGLSLALDGPPRGGVDLDLTLELEDGRVATGRGEALPGLAAGVPFAFDADLEAGTLRVVLDDAPFEATAVPSALRVLGIELPPALRFVGGLLHLDGTVGLADAGDGLQPSGRILVRSDGLDISYGKTRIDGLAFRTRLDLGAAYSGAGDLAAASISLAAGLDLTAFSTELSIHGEDDLDLTAAGGEMLGGRLQVAELRIIDGAPGASTVEWLGFDLSRLLSYLDVAGLDGTGTLDARLPLVARPDGLAIEDGAIEARGPGRLRYRSGAPATNLGLQALENFEYESLDGKLNYAPNGKYTIALRLLGRNPDLYGGHPVRFRLNLGGELPAPFRTLFLTGDFDQAIIDQIRSGESEVDDAGGS